MFKKFSSQYGLLAILNKVEEMKYFHKQTLCFLFVAVFFLLIATSCDAIAKQNTTNQSSNEKEQSQTADKGSVFYS